MHKLLESISQLEINIDRQQMLAEEVSKSSVGWHIEHALLTINAIIGRIENSEPEKYRKKFSFPKILVFTMNKIPRGRAKSPATVVPVRYDIESLRQHLEKTRSAISKLNALNADKYFEHPIFGDLKLKDTIKFLRIHTNHHLSIINDIVNAQK